MLYALLFLCLAAAYTIYHVAGLTAVVKKLHDKLEPAKSERPEPKYHLLVSELKEGTHYRCMLSDRLVCVSPPITPEDENNTPYVWGSLFNEVTGTYEEWSFFDNQLYTTNINLAPRELKEREIGNRILMDLSMGDERRERERRQRDAAAQAAARDYTAPTEEGGIPGLVEMEASEPRQFQSRIQRILAMPVGHDKLNALIAHEQEVKNTPPPACPMCQETKQLQLVDHANLGGPLFKCRTCKWKFNGPLLK